MNRILSYSRSLFTALASFAVVSVGSLVMLAAGSPKHVVREYFPNGVLARETEMDSQGERHGLNREWYDTGILLAERKFDHGEWVFARRYSPSGKLVSELTEGANFLPLRNVIAE